MSSKKIHIARKMMTSDERKRVIKTKKVTINNEGERCISTVTSRVGVSPLVVRHFNLSVWWMLVPTIIRFELER